MNNLYQVFDGQGRFESVFTHAISSFRARLDIAAKWGVDYLDLYAIKQ